MKIQHDAASMNKKISQIHYNFNDDPNSLLQMRIHITENGVSMCMMKWEPTTNVNGETSMEATEGFGASIPLEKKNELGQFLIAVGRTLIRQ